MQGLYDEREQILLAEVWDCYCSPDVLFGLSTMCLQRDSAKAFAVVCAMKDLGVAATQSVEFS